MGVLSCVLVALQNHMLLFRASVAQSLLVSHFSVFFWRGMFQSRVEDKRDAGQRGEQRPANGAATGIGTECKLKTS